MTDRFQCTGPFDDEMPYYYVIISDYRWWVDNEKAIYAWMKDNLPKGTAHHQGMVVTLDTDQDVSNFLLRWA